MAISDVALGTTSVLCSAGIMTGLFSGDSDG